LNRKGAKVAKGRKEEGVSEFRISVGRKMKRNAETGREKNEARVSDFRIFTELGSSVLPASGLRPPPLLAFLCAIL
jgi:hypothetical protein